MKKKSILSLFLALAMMLSLTVGVVATESEGDTTIEETIDFDFKKVSVSMKDNLRMNYKLTLPEGVDPKNVTLYVWKGAVDGVDYTNIKKDEQPDTRTAVSYTGADGDLSVFQYADITAKDIGTILYARACYNDGTQDVYTRTLRYSVSLYAMELYSSADSIHPGDETKAQTLRDLCLSILNYGMYAAQYAMADETNADYSYLHNGISEITLEDGKTADGFTSVKCHTMQPITLIPDTDKWTEGESCWLKNGEFYSINKELTVEANTDTYTVAKLADYGENFQLVSNSAEKGKYRSLNLAVAAAASGDTIKLLADETTDGVELQNGDETHISLTLDLNGHTLSSDASFPFDIYNASLAVTDSSANDGGSITTTGGHVFYLNSSTSVLHLEAGTFTSVRHVIYAPSGVAHVKSGVEITDADSTEVFVDQGATATFGFDPTNLVDLNYNTVTPNEDGTWTVTYQESTGDEDSEGSLPSVIYFQNNADWASVKAYVYNSGDDSYPEAWPGTAMTLVKDNVYSYELPAGYDTVIFNNGADQTADESIPTDGKNLYTYNADGTGEWSVYSILASDVATDSTYDADVLAFFTNGGTNTLQLTKDASVANDEGYIVIPANANLTLDLNGYTLVGSIALRDGATLTVKDSVGGGKIIDEGGTSNYYIFSSQWDANLVIEGGEFIPSASKPAFDWSSGSVTLKGGTFHENPCATNGVIIDDEYMLKENENGTWTVIPMEDPNVPAGGESVEPETT